MKIEDLKCFQNLVSPVEDQGLDYIWYCTYPNGSYGAEYDDKLNKYDFKQAYETRALITQFGIFGKHRKLYFNTSNGVFTVEDKDGNITKELKLKLKFDDGKEYKINDTSEIKYHNITARKYIHADIKPGGTIETSPTVVDNIAFGYLASFVVGMVKFNTVYLYRVYPNGKDLLTVSLTADDDFKGILYCNDIGTDIDLKENNRTDYAIALAH